MSYSSQATKYGRIPTVFIELDMDFCANVYSSSPCTAAIGVTGAAKCYNTYATCQDKTNFNKTTKTYRFCEQNADLPVGLSAIPLLKSVTFASQEITPNKGLGVRGSVSISFLDAPWPDTEIDPYFKERNYDTQNQGTFWGKFKARNPYYENRVLRVRRGYIGSPFSFTDFIDSVYIIEQLQGIAKDDSVKIIAKDILKLADDKKALFPQPSNGRLSANIDAVQTSFSVSPSGIGAEYEASGKVAISGEVMVFTRVGDVFTVTRGASNTVAEAHNVEDTVQEVGIFSGEKIQDVIYTLLTTYSGISTSYIDKTAWDAEATAYLAGVWSAEIPEPTGINTLVGELTEQGTCRVWWDELAQLIQFRAIKPLPSGLPVLSDESHFLTKSIDVKTDTNQRISTVFIYFAQKLPTKKLDDLENYALRVATPNLEAISSLEYGSNLIKKVFSRWFKSTSQGRANALADALLKTYRDPPQIIEFNLTPALQLKVGDLFLAQTRKMQDVTGAIASVPMEVIYAQPTERDDIKYKAQQVSTAIPNTNVKNLEVSTNYGDLVSNSFDNYNVYNHFVADFGLPEPNIIVIVTVLSNVVISSTDVSIPAFVTDDRWPDNVTLKLVNNGTIAGRGGDGGNTASPGVSATNGKDGGHGIFANYSLIIDNQSVIAGGGGGGGAGGAVLITRDGSNIGFAFGGGGGAGAPFGVGGTVDGQSSTGLLGGLGGNGQIGMPTGNGGKGGDLGQNGINGSASSGFVDNGSNTQGTPIPFSIEGSAGDAIHGNNLITWVNTGTIYGDIVP